MKHSVGPPSVRLAERPAAASEPAGPPLSLRLADDYFDKARGYDPYDTVTHARATREHDVWRNKPKRA